LIVTSLCSEKNFNLPVDDFILLLIVIVGQLF